jgi:hypothetical protein
MSVRLAHLTIEAGGVHSKVLKEKNRRIQDSQLNVAPVTGHS